MCGIGLILLEECYNEECDRRYLNDENIINSNEIKESIAKNLSHRGPDYPLNNISTSTSNDNNSSKNKEVSLFASILHIRGEKPMLQPVTNENNDLYFCWNGECYEYLLSSSVSASSSASASDVNSDLLTASDTSIMFQLLSCAKKHEEITQVFSRIHGEYAFIFYDKTQDCIYFGRDSFGRRSLLLHQSENNDSELMLSSTSFGEFKFEEVMAGHVYCYHISSKIMTSLPIIIESSTEKLAVSIPTPFTIQFENISKEIQDSSKQLFNLLHDSVQKRCLSSSTSSCSSTASANIAILFSGGLDSVVLAALLHHHIPASQSIDLLNVSFSSAASASASPDRLASIVSYVELKRRYPKREWRLLGIDVDYSKEVLGEHETQIKELIHPLETVMDFNIGAAFYFASRGYGRLITVTLDDTLFQRSHDIQVQKKEKVICSKMHCTKIAHDGCLFQACKLCCKIYQRPINKYLGAAALLCPIHNIKSTPDKSESKKKSKQHALLRQSMGQSILPNSNNIHYSENHAKCTAKILFNGIGADEYMGGYGRHRSCYKQGGYSKVQSELKMEQDRLWKRNLGRDDRVISHFGRELRCPFLDIHVVNFLTKIEINQICDFELREGCGDKLILRCVAQYLGMYECSTLVKRAIQFGSRIAKESNLRQFGSIRKASGTAVYQFQEEVPG